GFRGGAFSGNYAVSTALHVQYPHVGQGESSSVLHATAMRLAQDIDPQSARQVAEAIGVWSDGMTPRQAADAVADTVESIYTRVGVPTALRQLDIPQDDLSNIARATTKNFNFNPGARSPEEQVEASLRLLQHAW